MSPVSGSPRRHSARPGVSPTTRAQRDRRKTAGSTSFSTSRSSGGTGQGARPGQPPDAGMRRAAQAVPGNTRKDRDRDRIMTMPLTHLLVAVAGLATACCVVATSGNAAADDMGALAPAPAELMQWHSGLTVTSDSSVKPEWRSTLNAIDPDDSAALLQMHGAVSLRDGVEDGFDYSLDSLDTPKGARKSARNPAGTQGGSAQRTR